MANFDDLVLPPNTRANQPAAGIAGRIYYVTDENVMERDNGSAWVDYSPPAGLTNPMTTQGDVIYGGASGVPTRLAKGTAAQVLAMNAGATAPEWATGGGGLVLLEQHTASNSATLNFTTAISSVFDEYLIEYIDVLPATNNTILWMRVSTDGGANYEAGAAVYRTAAFRLHTSAASVVTGGTNSAFLLSGVDGIYNNAAGGGVVGSCKLFNPGGSNYKKIIGNATHRDGTNAVQEMVQYNGEWTGATTAVNAVRFLMSSGNITSGTIRIYGFAK
jgi:hypothetical protein